MTYCINFQCLDPNKNDTNVKFCMTCGAKILLKERYHPQALLGQGGFGKTFKAIDEDRPRKPLCVIKQFSYHNADPHTQQVALGLFYEEARHLESLGSHPQIPELMAYFDVDGQPYLVQEFIDGQDLAQELESSGIYNSTQVRELLTSLLPVLNFLHSQSIPVIHRDLKPANIIRRRSNRELVLVDFGAAKQATQTMLARTGTTIGSPEYSAPEQIRGKPAFASDIFSLGVTCIHLLTGISPFDLFDVNRDEWVWRDYLIDNPIEPQLAEILDKMIANSLPRRYQSAVEVLASLGLSSTPSYLPQSSQIDTPQNAENFYHRAILLEEESQDFEGALANYSKAIELNPQFINAFCNRGTLKIDRLHDIAGALADYDRAIELNPKYAPAYGNRGRLKYKKKNFAGALADYDKAMKLDPKYTLPYVGHGAFKEFKLEDFVGALADYERAIELDPKYALAYRHRGNLKVDRLKDVSGGLIDLNKAIELNPKSATVYRHRGIVKLNNLDDVSGALADFDRAIVLDPKYTLAYRNRGSLKLNSFNDVSGALTDFDRAILLDPEYADAYYNRANLKKFRIKDRTGAIQDFQQAATLYKQQGRMQDWINAIDRIKELGSIN